MPNLCCNLPQRVVVYGRDVGQEQLPAGPELTRLILDEPVGLLACDEADAGAKPVASGTQRQLVAPGAAAGHGLSEGTAHRRRWAQLRWAQRTGRSACERVQLPTGQLTTVSMATHSGMPNYNKVMKEAQGQQSSVVGCHWLARTFCCSGHS